MIRVFWIYLLPSLVFPLLLISPNDVANKHEIDIEAVDRFVTEYQNKRDLPGVSVVITKDQNLIHATGYGHDSYGAPMTENTLMPIASLSKSFTSLAVLQLVDAGKVNLDTPVQHYLKEFSMNDPRSSEVTVRQLLNHTSGMSDTMFPEKSISPPGSLKDAVEMLRSVKLAANPGEKVQYHNPNYWVVARLIEVVSGESFCSYLNSNLFGPLGMKATTSVSALTEAADLAEGYIVPYGISVSLPEPRWYLRGASGIVTTGRDLAKWLIFQNNQGKTADGTPLVSEASIDLMHEGLGWNKRSENEEIQVYHTGWMFTYTAFQVLLPKSGYGIAVMSNKGLGLAPDDSFEIGQAIAGFITTGSFPQRGAPIGFIVDMILALFTLVVFVIDIRAINHVKEWAEQHRNRSHWINFLTLSRHLIPLIFFLMLPNLLGLIFGGRDGNWIQLVYLSTPMVILLAVAALLSLSILIAKNKYLIQFSKSEHKSDDVFIKTA